MVIYLFLLCKYQFYKNQISNTNKKIKSKIPNKSNFKFIKENDLCLYMVKNYLEIILKTFLNPLENDLKKFKLIN